MQTLFKHPLTGTWLRALGVCLLALPAGANDDFAAWADEQERMRDRITAVNEGALEFLTAPSDEAVHHHAGRISISAQSLVDGWVGLEQCHTNLDQVAEAQILFRPKRTRALHVESTRNVENAYPEGSSIQLRGIGANSEVCVSLETRALQRIDDGVFELQNGPYMRRFLDGYYPLRLTLRIEFPGELELADHSPPAQPGFVVVEGARYIDVNALFEGQLRTAFRFVQR